MPEGGGGGGGGERLLKGLDFYSAIDLSFKLFIHINTS